jgi:hypothetical protein
MSGLLMNQKLQVSVRPVMRRKLPPSARGCSPPRHPPCITVGEIAGLVSDRNAKELARAGGPISLKIQLATQVAL